MTYKYYDVRRDVNAKCSGKDLKVFRTPAEIKKVFKPSYWIMLILVVLLLITMLILQFCSISILWNLIPASLIYLWAVIMDYKFDAMLNESAKIEEREKLNNVYSNYIRKIQETLLANGIDNCQKRTQLKNECKLVLDKHELKYKNVRKVVWDFFIGIPAGALLSAIMYKGGNTLISGTTAILISGAIFLGIVKICERVSFYTEGYLKDKNLLNALNELDYSLTDEDNSKERF